MSIRLLAKLLAVSAWALPLALVAYPLTVRAQATPIQLTAGDTTTLVLDGNPSTGYRWELEGLSAAATNCVGVDLRGYVKKELAPGERPVLGAPQKFEVLVTGLAPCQVTLGFKYVRSGTAGPGGRKEFVIEVLGQARDVPPTPASELQQDPTSDPVTDGKNDLFADPDSD